MAGRGSAGRAADLSGPTRPVPVAGWCRRHANTSLAMARAAPRPRGTQPRPRDLSGLVVREPGRRPVVTPGLRRRDVLARRGDPWGGHHREIPGNSAGHRGGWPAGRGPVRRGGLAGRRQGAGVLVTAMPRFPPCRRRYHRDDAAEPGGNPSSTGHVWITIWCRYGRDLFRIFSPPSLPTASVLVTGHGAARVSPRTSPGAAPRSGVYAQFIDESCAQPPTLVISPGLA
jgi:hypothetical protein